MKPLIAASLLAVIVLFNGIASSASKPADAPARGIDDYQPGPDSQRQPGVPEGKTFQFKLDDSKIFPGTHRSIGVYVPAAYKPNKPACVYINLDGLGFGAQVVFDNLIHKNEMPVTIGIGIGSGQVDSADPPNDPRFNRSFEFDGLNDSLARFILEEVLPEVEKHQTPDGQAIVLSKDPNDRCVAGGSTGAIAAFTLAWERPDQFRRVFTAIGTFVGMRGGDRYPVLVRKTEPKSIRIFMQDGSNDEWMGGPEVGDWWMSNQTLERALEFSGYDVQHEWGTGPHSGKHAAAIFPDVMRFLWKDYPQPIKAGQSQNTFLKGILLPQESWQPIEHAPIKLRSIAANSIGEIFYLDEGGNICSLSARGQGKPIQGGDSATAFAFGPEDKLFVADGVKEVLSYLPAKLDGSPARIDGLRSFNMVVTRSNFVYATSFDGHVWLIKPKFEYITLDNDGLNHPTGIAVSPDGLWLAIVENKTHWGYSYKVNPDGTVSDKQKFYWLTVSDTADDSGAEAICFDKDGRLYVATRMGVQVLDRNGRTRAILPMPWNAEATGLCFGGANFDTLFVAAGGKIYQRKMKSAGLAPGAAPIKLPPWGAG